MNQRAILLSATALVLVLAVVWSTRGTPLDNAAAIVLLSDRATDCQVMRHGVDGWRRLPCVEVPRYLGDALHLLPGESIGIEASGTISQAAIDELTATLKKSGYAVAGVIRVVFISVPNGLQQ